MENYSMRNTGMKKKLLVMNWDHSAAKLGEVSMFNERFNQHLPLFFISAI